MIKPKPSKRHRLKYPLDDPNSRTYVKGDPVVEQFKVIFNNNPDNKTKLYVMQYLSRNKNEPLTFLNKSQGIREFRIKPKSGQVEADININQNMNYDMEKGESYGKAMRESRVIQPGGSYGLVGGFGMSVDAIRKGERPVMPSSVSGEDVEMADLNIPYPSDGNDKMDTDNPFYWVFNKLTVGGRVFPRKPTDPIYLLGTFVGGTELHLTPIDAIIQMRPQLDHCDAEDELIKAHKARDSRSKGAGVDGDESDSGDSSGNGNSDKDVEHADDESVVEEIRVPGDKSKDKVSEAGSSDGDEDSEHEHGAAAVRKKGKVPARRQPRAVQMSAKTVRLDGEDTDMTNTARALRNFQEEDWIRLAYVDENTDESWDVYREKCILRNAKTAAALKAAQLEGRWISMIGTPKKCHFEDSWQRRQERQAKQWGFGYEDGQKPEMIEKEDMDAKLKTRYPERSASDVPTQVEIWEAQQQNPIPKSSAPYFDADLLYYNSSSGSGNSQYEYENEQSDEEIREDVEKEDNVEAFDD